MRMTAGALVILLFAAACSSSAIIAGPPHTPGAADVTNPGEVTVDFFQTNELVGRINVRSSSGVGEYVHITIEVPIVPDQDYRLDSATFEFRSDVIEPLIMLAPGGRALTEGIIFSRIEPGTVRLEVPDTGAHGDGTMRFEFLAGRDAIGSDGMRLHASLQFGAGDAQIDMLILPGP